LVDSFVYCWTDHKTQKLYVGVHKGSPTDGYVCSGKLMLEEHSTRADDFTRQIIAEGIWENCVSLERAILRSVDARNNEEYYNQHNGNGQINLVSHSEEARKKMSKARKGEKGYWFGKKRSEEAVKKMAATKRARGQFDENHPMRGKKHSEEAKKKMSKAHKGTKASKKTKQLLSSQRFGRSWWNDGNRNKFAHNSPGPEWNKGRLMENTTCSKCGFIGNAGNMAIHICKGDLFR